MQRLTGVVMESTGKYVVVLTPTGEFRKVKVVGRTPAIGEEIVIPVERRRTFRMPLANWVAVAAAVILLLVANPLLTVINQPPETTMAYVSIEVNPSIELAVGDRYHILGVHAYNSDGERVLKGLDIKGMEYREAVAAIKDRIEELGYLKKRSANTVLVSVAFLPSAKVDKKSVENTLIASANNIFSDDNIKVATIKNVPAEFRENARKKGISFGKYAVLIEAVNSGLPLTEKSFQEKPITDAISAAGGQPEEIISRASEEEQFAAKEKQYLVLMAVNDRLSNPTVASADDGSAAGREAEPALDSGSQKNKYVDSVRNSRGPEDTGSDKKGSRKPTVLMGTATAPERTGAAGEASSPDTTAPSSPVAGKKPAEPGAGTGKTAPPADAEQPENPDNDKKTEDNYMADEDDKPAGNNDDMSLLKPNF